MIKRILNKLYIYLKLGRFQKITLHRLEMLQQAFKYAKNEKVEGEYFEFGVARGLTFSGAYHVAQKYDSKVSKFFAFDSFQGFPELGEVDKEFERFSAGEERWNSDEFDDWMNKTKVPKEAFEVFPGWFENTLNRDLENKLLEEDVKAAVVWIDCDLYKSTVPVLKFIKRFLHNGTVVIFDDWFCYHADPNKGEQRALNEFLKENKEFQFIQYRKFGVVGNSFIVHKKNEE